MKKALIFILLLNGFNSFSGTVFDKNINIHKKFRNGYICSDKEYEELKIKSPDLFKVDSTTKNQKRTENCPFISTDILKITKIDEKKIKVNMQTYFFNGHQCSLINEEFKLNGDSYLFQRNEFDSKNDKDICSIKISIDSDKVSFKVLQRDTQSGCRVFCGARGTINDAVFYRAQ